MVTNLVRLLAFKLFLLADIKGILCLADYSKYQHAVQEGILIVCKSEIVKSNWRACLIRDVTARARLHMPGNQ